MPDKPSRPTPGGAPADPPAGSSAGALLELRAVALAGEALARDPKLFAEAFEASAAGSAERFQAALDRAGLADQCARVCYLFCEKRCVGLCRRLCVAPVPDATADEVRAFAVALGAVARQPDALAQLAAAADVGDPAAWLDLLKRLQLDRFCHQVCHFVCRERCRVRCGDLCSRPEITRISAIPTSRVDPQGFAHGPSVPPFLSPPDAVASGVGDHPVGGSSWLMGRLNMAAATEYRVEVASAPGGPYDPIAVAVDGYDELLNPVTRFPSGGADPGWYQLAAVPFSDGGPSNTGEKTLLYWPTGSKPDGVYYLRLRARGGGGERVSAPRTIRTDNTPPPTPVITLELQLPNGERRPLKCGQVRRGEGLIRVTVQAADPNFSALGVSADGNSSLSVPVTGVPEGSPPGTLPVPLSKTYNGNTADTGYPAPTVFLWDPWSNPRIVPCCYLVRIAINDRTIINNAWAGGWSNAGWEAIEIGF